MTTPHLGRRALASMAALPVLAAAGLALAGKVRAQSSVPTLN